MIYYTEEQVNEAVEVIRDYHRDLSEAQLVNLVLTMFRHEMVAAREYERRMSAPRFNSRPTQKEILESIEVPEFWKHFKKPNSDPHSWKPISQAPDHTWVIVRRKGEIPEVASYTGLGAAKGWRRRDGFYVKFNPTHYTEIPEFT